MQSKRIIAVFIILIFCATLAIGSSAVFSIAEVNAKYSFVSSEQIAKTENIEAALERFEGKNIVFIKKAEIYSALKDFTYIEVRSITKTYPNILTVELNERLEVFALNTENGWFMLDGQGFALSQRGLNTNNIDGLANIELYANADAALGKECVADNSALFKKCLYAAQFAAEYFNLEPRQVLEGIRIEQFDIAVILKGGFEIYLQDAAELFYEKINKAFDFYTDAEEMTQEMKANKYGRILAHKYESGVRATYTTS